MWVLYSLNVHTAQPGKQLISFVRGNHLRNDDDLAENIPGHCDIIELVDNINLLFFNVLLVI